MKKLAVCECCGNIFMIGDRVWKYRGDKLCSEECARKAEFLGKQGKWKNTTDEKDESNAKMKEIKLMIDGKEVQLTDEQLKALGIEIEEKRKNPFERVKPNERYHYVTSDGVIDEYIDANDATDAQLYKISNYFNDEAFAEQVALHQLFYRKLLKFIYDNECKDTAEWNGGNPHWYITYATDIKDFVVGEDFVFKAHSIYFSSEEAAEYAIEKVIKPFIEKYPEFIW